MVNVIVVMTFLSGKSAVQIFHLTCTLKIVVFVESWKNIFCLGCGLLKCVKTNSDFSDIFCGFVEWQAYLHILSCFHASNV